MLKIVLVDDEQLIIHHLIKLISTFDIPHKIVGTANNNEQALTIIRETHPNLVITDIRMGTSNGLDLCDTLQVTMPHTRLIILSGFDDFAYAQKALHYRVSSYLLKPINERELYELLSRIHSQIMEEEEAECKDFLLKKQIRECLPLMQEWFFKIIQEHQNNLEMISSAFLLFHIDILNPLYESIYIDFSQEENSLELERGFINTSRLAQTIMLLSDSSLKSIYFYDFNSVTLVLSSDRSPAEMHRQVYQFADRIRQYLNFNYDHSFSIGLSSVVQEISLLQQSVQDAIFASKYSFYIGYNEIICITDVELRNANEVIPDFKYMEEELLKYVKLCDRENSLQTLHIFYLNVLQLHGERNLAVNKFLELYYFLANALHQEFDLDISLSHDTAKQINDSQNLEKIQTVLTEYIHRNIDAIELLRTHKSQKFIQLAKAHIDEHYAQDISLESIAYEIGLSACYLSTLFKNIEKVSIKEYITNVRIEASKTYLKDVQLKIYEVAANVGYMDSRYFSQLFRKKTGYTPGQYREFLQKSET